MSNESSGFLLNLSLAQFTQTREVSDGFIECYCASCNRLIAASRERYVLDVARQKHECAEVKSA